MPGYGWMMFGDDEVDAGGLDELEGAIEDGGVVAVQTEHEGAHDVDAGVVHALHALVHAIGFRSTTCRGRRSPSG